MSSDQEYIRAADHFLAAPKEIVGVTTPQLWHEGRELGDGCQEVKFPIEVNGEQLQGASFIVRAFPNSTSLNFHLMLVFQWTICRLDFDLDAVHTNFSMIARERGIPLAVRGPHYHPWERNRGYVRDVKSPFRLPVATSLDQHIRQFDAALRWFCNEVNINLRNHAIQLPVREILL